MFEFGIVDGDAQTVRDAIIVATLTDDMEVSDLSLKLAARDVRLFRINVDALPLESMRSIDQERQVITSHGPLRPKLFWQRYPALNWETRRSTLRLRLWTLV